MTDLTPLEKAKAWSTNNYFDENSRTEIAKLIEENNEKEITERFYKDLEFGTGGMRSILGQGTNRMNRYNIRKASYAVAQTILKDPNNNKKVAISYDTRRFSFEFAKESACVFAALDIETLIYNEPNPVALCSFAIRHHECSAGVMVTASHNPPEYNGFKVFWSDGAQVTPPNDQNIINTFNGIEDYSIIAVANFEQAMNSGLIKWVPQETEDAYYQAIKEKSLNLELCQKEGQTLKIVYTPIHGTGLKPCTRALQDLGLSNIEVVKEQAEGDGNFPTVSSPNPENPEALAMAVELMKKTGSDLTLGTDPDTDRVGLALDHEGQTHYLNGNQIGILMLHYLLTQLKEKNAMPTNPYFVKTIVTSRLQDHLASQFGVKVENTLTGFKWICGRMNEIEKENPEANFLFATEESFGYLNHEYVRDKDGVSSIALLCEVALWYKTQGMNLLQGLDQIYEQFGFSQEELLCLDYKGKEGAEKIARIMDHFRNYGETSLGGHTITIKEDYQQQEIKNFTDDSLKKISLPKSNVLGFHFNDDVTLYLRPSGTEPKIKFYIMVQEKNGDLKTKKSIASEKINNLLEMIKSTCKDL